MSFIINLATEAVKKDLPKINPKEWEKLKKIIKQKLGTNPNHFGQNLRTPLKKYRKRI